MNENQIRERLREAVGEHTVPGGLSSRVEARLRSSSPNHGARPFARGGQGPWLAGLGRTGSLVAALLVVVIIAALVVGVHAWRDRGLLNEHPSVPAGKSQSIAHYQSMLFVDNQRVLASQSNNCVSLTDACPRAVAAVVATAQQWLADLNAAPPPARFVYVDAEMRRHIALAISGLQAAAAAYNAKNQTGMDDAINMAAGERDMFEAEVNDVVNSSQGTIATYTGVVRTDGATMLGCAFCQLPVSQNQMTCPASQRANCATEIAGVRLSLETFQGDVVYRFAPDSLAAKDARLQADLFAADGTLSAMDSALSAGDHPALQTAYGAFRQALSRIDSDVAAIVNGS